MYLAKVAYAQPRSLQDVLSALREDSAARPLAGGQTLINAMKSRVVDVGVLVDLGKVDELRGVSTLDDGGLEIGAMTTLSELSGSAAVREARPVLAKVAGVIADVQVRNRGTIGGNLCANDPTNHLPPLLVALDATMTIAGAEGQRQVKADDFFVGVYMTAVAPGELLTRIHIPAGESADHFAAVTVGVEGTCIVNASASFRAESVRIAIGCVSSRPFRAHAIEDRLAGVAIDEAIVRDAARGLGDSLDPPGDVHATAAYRRFLAEELVIDAVVTAQLEGMAT